MSAATIDHLLQAPRDASRAKKARRVTSEIRRRVPVRTFADWKEPVCPEYSNGKDLAVKYVRITSTFNKK